MSVPTQAGQSASEVPGDLLLIATFADEDAAAGALAAMLQAKAEQNWAVSASAVVRREDDGRISVKETGDVGVGTAAAAGGALGGLLGMLFGKPVLGAGLGALLGAGAGKVVDAGINDARLQQIAEGLANGSSAVAAIVGAGSLSAAKGILIGLGADVVAEPTVAGATVNVPKTGNEQIDQWVQSASAAVQPYADQAARSVSSAASSAEQIAGQVSDQAKQAWSSATGGEKPTTPDA